MSDADRQRWDSRYAAQTAPVVDACYALKRYRFLLPPIREHVSDQVTVALPTALDLACGLGGNALFLARLGYDTHAWDVSSVAQTRLQSAAEEQGLAIQTECRDVVASPPEVSSFDVVVVSRFLDRSIIGDLIASLKPKGLVFYQTFTDQARSGPTNPDYLLKENELLQLFAPLRIRAFEDAALSGNTAQGLRDESCIVAENSEAKAYGRD